MKFIWQISPLIVSDGQDFKDRIMTRKKATPIDDNIGKLVELVGPREELPAVIKARLTRTFKDELAKARIARRRLRLMQTLSVAAVLMLTVVITWLYPTEPITIPTARVMVAKGEVNWISDRTRDVLRQGNQINNGDSIETGPDGRVNLAMHDTQTSIRLDVNTRITFNSEDELRLDSGWIYVDSGLKLNERTDNPLRIVIGGITVNHLGTQYMVGFIADQVSIAVREGTVQIKVNDKLTEGNGTSKTAELLDIDKDGNINTSYIPRNNSQWTWINQISPTFDTDQRRAIDFLKWYTRETGRELQFKHTSDEITANETKIIGNYPTVVADAALHDVLRVTDLRVSVLTDSVLEIESI